MNIARLQKAYFDFYEWGKKKLLSRYNKSVARGYIKDLNVLTKEEKQQIADFWAPYVKVDPVFHTYFKTVTGKFYPHWLPTDIYINIIDEYFNDRKAAHVLDNKGLYARIFSGIPQIPSVVSRMGGFWYSEQGTPITYEKALEAIAGETALFVKAAARSSGGEGVKYIDKEKGSITEQFAQTLASMPGDIVVQRPVRQHPTLAALNQSSVNTLRALSMLSEDGVKIYACIVRMGVGDSKLDNASAGGVFCGVRSDNTLTDTAYKLSGGQFKAHPTSGVVFDGYSIVGYDKMKALIEKAHPMVPYFHMVSWDIVIDEQGEALMLEANLAKSGLESLQFTNGPLFGEDTKAILDEVFGKKKL